MVGSPVGVLNRDRAISCSCDARVAGGAAAISLSSLRIDATRLD
jgi:hypothetical protein